MYLDVCRSGTFPEKSRVSVLLIATTDHAATERLTSDSLGDVSWVQKAVLQLYRRNVPLLHSVHPTHRYVTASDEFYQAFSHISTASDKHWGPGN